MKIGIMTFHWSANYGAVMQAYALSEYLKREGAEPYVIDYYPARLKKNLMNAFITRHISAIPSRLKELSKEKNIKPFRERNLNRTKYFKSNKQLKRMNFGFDCYICGSDQIWNESFFEHGERKRTYSYLLNFAPEDCIIASYAASFGVTKYKESLKDDLKKYLERFDFISVRENSGLNILKDIGINKGCVVPDPTLLLQKEDYEKLLNISRKEYHYTFVYMLHNREVDAADIVSYVKKTDEKIVVCKNEGIEEWLTEIYYADSVITNSFHGTVFSILFQKPFITVLIEGSGMNDRIVTLLDMLGLSDRIYHNDASVLNRKIDWECVSAKLDEFREKGCKYIKNILNYKKRLEI